MVLAQQQQMELPATHQFVPSLSPQLTLPSPSQLALPPGGVAALTPAALTSHLAVMTAAPQALAPCNDDTPSTWNPATPAAIRDGEVPLAWTQDGEWNVSPTRRPRGRLLKPGEADM